MSKDIGEHSNWLTGGWRWGSSKEKDMRDYVALESELAREFICSGPIQSEKGGGKN